jgi:hypothetical protein
MSRWLKQILAPSLAAALSVLAGCEGRGGSEAQSAKSKPEPAQVVSTAVDLDGRPRDPLVADGRADVLLFVRTDCPISNRYAPEIGRIAARFADQGVELWLVYVDPDETPELIRRHVAEYDLPGTALRDPEQSLVGAAGVKVTPEGAVFDGEGRRRYRGRIDDWYADFGKPRARASTHELVDAVEAVLAGREPTVTEAEAVGCPLPP